MNQKCSSIIAALMMGFMSIGVTGITHADDTASSISQGDARKFNKVLKGTILQVSDAKIESKKSTEATGVAAGAAVGGVAGNGFGSGRGSLVSTIGGAVVGGILGGIGGAMFGNQDGQDLIIQVDDGDVINITQADDEKIGKFAEGDAVLVIYKGDSARVLRNKMSKI